MEKKKLFVDAIAGAGKTTSMINLAAYYAERGEVPLILTFQKEDRIHVGKRLSGFGFKVKGSYRTGITVFEKRIKDKTYKLYVSNLHSLAYVSALKMDFSPVLIDEDPFFWNEFMKMERTFGQNPFETNKLGDFLYAGYQIAKSFNGILDKERFMEHPGGQLWLHLGKEENLTFDDLIEFEKKLKDAKFEYQKYVSAKESEKPERLRQNKVVVEYSQLIDSFESPVEDVTLVFIDEGQDWQEFWFRKILHVYRNCRIMVLGDTNQAVFTSSGGVFPYNEVMKELGFREVVNEKFRTTKRAPEGAYDEALFYQVRNKKHLYQRKGKIIAGDDLDFFVDFSTKKKVTGGIVTRIRADERKFYHHLVSQGIPALRSNEEHKWESLKECYYNKSENITYSDVEPFLKESIKTAQFQTEMPINKTSLIEFLIEKRQFEKLLDEKFYNFLVNEKEPIRVTTIHRAKGKEYDAVYLVERKTHKIMEIENEFPVLELPVSYVARTRHRRAFFKA